MDAPPAGEGERWMDAAEAREKLGLDEKQVKLLFRTLLKDPAAPRGKVDAAAVSELLEEKNDGNLPDILKEAARMKGGRTSSRFIFACGLLVALAGLLVGTWFPYTEWLETEKYRGLAPLELPAPDLTPGQRVRIDGIVSAQNPEVYPGFAAGSMQELGSDSNDRPTWRTVEKRWPAVRIDVGSGTVEIAAYRIFWQASHQPIGDDKRIEGAKIGDPVALVAMVRAVPGDGSPVVEVDKFRCATPSQRIDHGNGRIGVGIAVGLILFVIGAATAWWTRPGADA